MTILKIVSTNEKPTGEELARERSDIDLLHAISMDLIVESDIEALYGKIVDAAIAITSSQFGTMQLFRPSDDGSESGLQLLISRGLTPQDREVWQWVSPKAYSSCTLALKRGSGRLSRTTRLGKTSLVLLILKPSVRRGYGQRRRHHYSLAAARCWV